MKTVPETLRAHLDSDVTALASCWKIERRDGEVYRFTDSDQDITVDGETYLAIGAYSRTAIESTASLAVDNLSVQGIVDNLALPLTDLRAGLFDYATVYIFACSWMQGHYPGLVRLRKGYFGEVTLLANGTFKVELRGAMQRLSNDFMRVYTPDCLNDFSDSNCGVPAYGPVPKRGATVKTNGTYCFYDSALLNGAMTALNMRDAGFADLAKSGIQYSRYWYDGHATSASAVVQDSELDGVTYSAVGTSEHHMLAQDIVIIDGENVTEAAVDAGSVYLTLRCFRRDTGTSAARILVNFLDWARSDLGSPYSSGFLINPEWTETGPQDLVVPAGTRIVRFRFQTDPTGTNPETCEMNRPHGWLLTTDATNGTYPYALADKLLKAADTADLTGTAGTPLIADAGTLTSGETVSLAGASFGVHNAPFAVGKIIQVISPTEIIVKMRAGNADWIEGWFEVGLLQCLSGDNKGKAMEIKGWLPTGANNRTGTISLFLSLPFRPQVGDLVAAVPGCDKSRICCAVMWDNIQNFFGTPDVPGPDSIFEYPDKK